MSDIFREVEEDVRRERLEKLWKQYGAYLMALAALVLAGVGAYQMWQRHEAAQRTQDATQFLAAQQIRNPADAAKTFAALSKTAGAGYVPLSRLEQANALSQAGKKDQAVAIYKDLAGSQQGPIGAVARLRAAWLLADSAKRADLQTLLQPLLDPASAWRQMAEEVLAYNDYRSGKLLAASGEFAKLASDPASPDQLKQRAHAFAVFLAAGGDLNVGTVPPAPPATAPGASAATP